MSRRRATADASSFGLGIAPAAPLAPPKTRAKPAATPAAPVLTPPAPRAPAPVRREPPPTAPVAAPVVEHPRTPWGRVAAECPDRRGVDAHELATEHWTCSCGWTGERIAEHSCAGVTALERRAWVHIERTSGGPVRWFERLRSWRTGSVR